jgi:hypothetical protein
MIMKSKINFANRLAKTIRVLSVPPVMVTALILILYRQDRLIFRNTSDVVMPIVFLGFVPVLAYPLQHLIPALRQNGREAQRKLAFLLSMIGYTLALIWAVFHPVSSQMLLLCLTYFFSVVLLTLCNKALHVHASGHACSVTGPLLLLIYLVDWTLIFPCIASGLLIAWSSLYLKRHTAKELLTGSLVCLVSFAAALLCLT